MGLLLRDYQQECVKRVLAAYAQDPTGTELIVLPCGGGKTIVFSAVIHALRAAHGIHALVIADRDDLLDQAADKYRAIRPQAIIGKIGSGLHQYGGEVTVASIATISKPEHLKRLALMNYGLIITDEADLSAAPSYQKVYQTLPNIFHLMVTATPDRLDGKPIINKKPLFEKSILEMIRQHWLTDIKAIAIKTKIDLSGLHTQAGDFKPGELSDAVDTPARNAFIVEKYKEHTNGKRAVAFCVTVAHAQHLAEAFCEAGIRAEVVSGETPIPERKEIYKRFRTGQTLIMTNVMVLSRGWDEPLCEVGIGARPTQSRALFMQQLGRILRLAPGKPFATWLEVTDNCFNHRLEPQSLRKVLRKHFLKEDETILESEERIEREAAERRAQVRTIDADVREKDLTVDLTERLEWHPLPNERFVLELKTGQKIMLVPSHVDGFYDVWAQLSPGAKGQCWMSGQPLDWAQQYAEREAGKMLANPGAARWADRNHPNRRDPASDAQKGWLKWRHIPFEPTISKGEASELIDEQKRKDEAKKEAKEARAKAKEEKMAG